MTLSINVDLPEPHPALALYLPTNCRHAVSNSTRKWPQNWRTQDPRSKIQSPQSKTKEHAKRQAGTAANLHFSGRGSSKRAPEGAQLACTSHRDETQLRASGKEPYSGSSPLMRVTLQKLWAARLRVLWAGNPVPMPRSAFGSSTEI